MILTIELTREVEQRLRTEASRSQVDLTTYALQLIETGLPDTEAPKELSSEEWERLADELAAGIDSSIPLLSDHAVSREGIYADHD